MESSRRQRLHHPDVVDEEPTTGAQGERPLLVLRAPPRARSNRNSKIYGTSGGALTGCLLFLDIDLDALAEYAYICAAEARASIRGAFKLRDYCRGAITQFCTANAHEILQGRFEVSITRIFPWYKNLRVNNFPTYDFLIQSLMCSACITPLAGFPMWLKGHGLCFDGVVDHGLFVGMSYQVIVAGKDGIKVAGTDGEPAWW